MSNPNLNTINSFSNKEEYYLMNKDQILAKFYSSYYNDKLIFTLDTSSITALPPKFVSLDKFLESRTSVIQRSEAILSLHELGLKGRFDVLLANYGVSLADTLWVKRTTDKMSWSTVSPYRRKSIFDISWFLTASKVQMLAKMQYRPEYSTDGTFPKCWIMHNDKHALLKCGTSGAFNTGFEPFSDFYATQVEDKICKVSDYVRYDLTSIDYSKYQESYKASKFLTEEYDGDLKDSTRFATICDSFTDEKLGFVSACELGLNNYQDIWKYAKKLSDKDVQRFAEILLLDCLIVNVDRHLGNIGFLYDNDTFEIKSLAPIFDNNLSLLCCWVKNLDGTSVEYAQTCFSKLGVDFPTLGSRVLAEFPEYRSILESIAHDFEFEQVGHINLRKHRLADLSEAVRNQAKVIINR